MADVELFFLAEQLFLWPGALHRECCLNFKQTRIFSKKDFRDEAECSFVWITQHISWGPSAQDHYLLASSKYVNRSEICRVLVSRRSSKLGPDSNLFVTSLPGHNYDHNIDRLTQSFQDTTTEKAHPRLEEFSWNTPIVQVSTAQWDECVLFHRD